MHPFSALVGRAPRWQPALRWKRHFELRDEGQLYATLGWEKASGALVVARAAEGLWTFERSPRGTPSVQVRSAPDGASLALFQSDWTQGGRLVTSEGHGWLWGACSESRAAWSFRAHGGGARVDVRVDSMGLAPAGRVHFSDGFASDPGAPVLACLGWYLAVMALDDASLLVPAFAAAG